MFLKKSGNIYFISFYFIQQIKHSDFLPEAPRSIAFMVVITTLIFIWTAMTLTDAHVSAETIFTVYLISLTIAVPPALVACLSIGNNCPVL
jgi:hypothetical protein